MNYAIILAGGIGSRFWPLSRESEPKQFLDIFSRKPMLEQTILRVSRLIDKKNIYIATNKTYRNKITNFSKKLDIPGQNILFEPIGKNTLAPIGLITRKIYDKDKEAVILVLPSDHYIKNESRFIKILTQAISVAKKGFIVTLGIVPDKPETGYGYIKINSKSLPTGQAGKIRNSKVYKVERFIEKPALAKAKNFIKNKSYFWNSGMFVFRADIMLQEIKKFSPHNYGIINKIKENKSLNKLWKRFSSLSIDYAIMEKTYKMALIPADFGWSDLGSWQAIESLPAGQAGFTKKNKNGNIFKGCCVDIGSKNTLAWSSGRLLATVGLNNIIVVETKDALLVCAKDKTQQIKKLVKILKKKFKD